MWTRIAALGLRRSAFASKSSKDMQRSARLQSTNSTSAPASSAASGVAMKVLEGQRTVSPRTPANSRAASAPPAQLESPRLRRARSTPSSAARRRPASRPLTTARNRALPPRAQRGGHGLDGQTRSRTCRVRTSCLWGPTGGSFVDVAGRIAFAGTIHTVRAEGAPRLAVDTDSMVNVSIWPRRGRGGRSRRPQVSW